MQKINCHRCIYYFVTWEAHQPHGCKAYGFKAKMIPSMVVQNSSGAPCSYFTPKTPVSK
ncbi:MULTISPECIES: uracil-DNA glycosylase [unclassified Sulfuricurvum]|uniref:uracil-DNA glycosylase n=1 Tax=unclassified Sulfuricurvum TaxID=2632390 RepID=UPI000321FA76|nr:MULTISPECIES: uracil-DNA glycosylase [unclassified Sulfuricurvum]HBM36259.1 uracil-DNA glycosylase [Sulfuricurvum sp.]